MPSRAAVIAFLGKVTRRLVDEEMTVDYKAPYTETVQRVLTPATSLTVLVKLSPAKGVGVREGAKLLDTVSTAYMLPSD